MSAAGDVLREQVEVELRPGGPLSDVVRLAVRVTTARAGAVSGARHAAGGGAEPAVDGTPVATAVLVHGLASNAQMWDACAVELAGAGVTSVAVDLRGHGRSHAVPGPFDTDTAADDVAALVGLLREQGLATGPVVLAGQSWGGNVALRAAARHGVPDRVADALALVDGGWLRFDRDEPFEVLWERLAPPTWDGATWDDLVARLEQFVGGWGPHAVPAVLANLTRQEDGRVRNVLSRQAHESILRSMYDADPREDYPGVQVPVLLAPAGSGRTGTLLDEAVDGLAHPVLRRYPDAHHDLHLQHPGQLAGDLLALLDLARATGPAGDAGPAPDSTHPVHEEPA